SEVNVDLKPGARTEQGQEGEFLAGVVGGQHQHEPEERPAGDVYKMRIHGPRGLVQPHGGDGGREEESRKEGSAERRSAAQTGHRWGQSTRSSRVLRLMRLRAWCGQARSQAGLPYWSMQRSHLVALMMGWESAATSSAPSSARCSVMRIEP